MNSRDQHAVASIVAVLILCSLGAILNILAVRHWGDRLSPVDAYSEANALRETHEFIDRGLWVHDGLGNVLYGDLYPGYGFAADPDGRVGHVDPSGVYTHYPPGPEYLLYASMKLLGTQPVSRLRAVPIVMGWLATIYLGLRLRGRFGVRTALIVMVSCLALPISYDAFTEVHLIGYGFPLLLTEIGVCFGWNRLVWPFLALGFFQGWLSFDYAFLVILTPLAMELALPRLQTGIRARLRLACWRVLAAAAGFALAHALHFLQVWAFFGTFQAALHDMRAMAVNRSSDGIQPGMLPNLLETVRILYLYWIGGIAWPVTLIVPFRDPQVASLLTNQQVLRFFGISLGVWWIVLSACFLALSRISPRPSRYSGRFLTDWLTVTICGFIVCSLWVTVMKNHGLAHQHLLFRHLFPAFLLMVIFIAHRVLEPFHPGTTFAGSTGRTPRSHVPEGPAALPPPQ
jgi:hypothetical protein